MARANTAVMLFGAALIAQGCETKGVSYDNLRIYDSPYSGVDWSSDLRLKAQHHDHVGTRLRRITAYDDAGYDVLSLMDYSGNAELSHALQHRLWPPEDWVPSSILTTLVNLKLFIPNAEETGGEQHATSPFLTKYIEKRPNAAVDRQDWHYESMNEMFSLIRNEGGFPCLAHPWTFAYENFQGDFCVEIYSAYSAAKTLSGQDAGMPGNGLLLERWDTALERNQRIWGISVNDHYGPYVPLGSVPEEIRDSGKILVLSHAATLDAYRNAFERGAILAISDQATLKDRYPEIRSIEVRDTYAHIEAQGTVRWVTRGFTVTSGPTLEYTNLPPNVRYIRAEVENGGSRVYTQAFPVRPIGDVDGDYDIDTDDQAICALVVPSELSPAQGAACVAASAGTE